MGEVVTVVKQIRPWWNSLQPNFVAFFQVQRRLESQRTILISDGVCLFNKTQPDSTPVQIKMNFKIHKRWWSWKFRQSREREKINSRSRCREFPRRQIHGVSLVHDRQLERNWSVLRGKRRIPLNVKMDGRRFDVGVSDPFLKTF